jgi:hypothetical protein
MLTPETLRTVRAVGLDVDGTLSHDDHVIPERTIHALRRVSELGLPVFLLTGRARRNVLELAREIGLTNLVVSNNGAITFDPVEDTNVVFRPMDHEMVRSIVDLGHELGMDVTWWTEHDIYVEHHGPISDMLTDLNETDILVGDSTNLPDDVTKVMLFGTKDLLDTHRSTVLEKFPDPQPDRRPGRHGQRPRLGQGRREGRGPEQRGGRRRRDPRAARRRARERRLARTPGRGLTAGCVRRRVVAPPRTAVTPRRSTTT